MLGKVTKFLIITSKALRVMDKNLWGSPGLNRVNMENSGVYDCEEFIRNFRRERAKGRQKMRRINK